MQVGVFSSIGSSYFKAVKNGFVYLGRTNFILKPIVLVIALFYMVLLIPIAIFFYCLIILDWVGKIIDGIRHFFMDAIENNSYKVDNSLFSFLFRPIFIVILAPIFLLTLCIPKFSSSVDVDSYDVAEAGAGTFKRIQETFWRASKRLFSYVSQSFILLMPVVAVIAIFYSLVLIGMGFIFALLIPLDWISRFIEFIRDSIANFSNNQQQKIAYGFGGFLFVPPLLIMLAPVFLFLLIIPKFSGELMSNTH